MKLCPPSLASLFVLAIIIYILLPSCNPFLFHHRRDNLSITSTKYQRYCYIFNMYQTKPKPKMANIRQSTETDPLILTFSSNNDNELLDSPILIQEMSTGQKILDLAIPAAGALLIDPLMALVDTAFVGRFPPQQFLGGDYTTTAAPLAGMGSAMALLTFTFYLFNFLCTTTTPLVAQKRSSGNEAEAIILGGQVLSLSLILGSILTVLLLSFKQPFLHIMGTGNLGADSNNFATMFLSIRAFAAPAILCIEASTGVLRGFLDTKTPIFVLIAANVINLILDIILVVVMRLGPMGAAIATTAAEWISAGLFLAILSGQLPSVSRNLGTYGAISENEDSDPFSKVITPVWAIPSWKQVEPLFIASTSVFFRAIILQVTLSSAAALAARSGGEAASVAAHQIGIQLWLICSFFCDSLAAASQGLVADAIGRMDRNEVVNISKIVFSYSLSLGIALALLLQLGVQTNFLLDVFTNDQATQVLLEKILPLIIFAQPLNALVFAADGILQGAAEFPFQAKAMALSGLTALGTYVALESLDSSNADTLVHIWSALIALQLSRGVTSLWKLVDQKGPIKLLS